MIESDRARRTFLAALLAGLLVRFILVTTTLGTSDILYWRLWYSIIDEHGILEAYRFHSELNHPPLSLLILLILGRTGDAFGILVSEPLRVLQVLADAVTTICLLGISRHIDADRPVEASIVFLLSPIAFLISGFHGNTDSLMIAFLSGAVLAIVRKQTPGWVGGLLLACSVGIKIVPLALLPFFFSASRGRRFSMSTSFSVATLVIFLPGFWVSDTAFVRNVFGYSPTSMKWGLAGILRESGIEMMTSLVGAWDAVGSLLIAAAIMVLWFVARSRITTERLPSYLAVSLLLFLAIAPGAGLRYLIWPLPFLPYLFSRRHVLLFHVVGSAGLATVYTIWARGFPWFFATPIDSPPHEQLVPWIGLGVWIMVVGLTVAGLRAVLTPGEKITADTRGL